MSCQLSCKWFSLSQRIGVMAHPATQQIQNVSVALCCAAIILPRFLFQGSPRPPGIYRTWKGRTKTVLFPGPGSSAVVGDDGMNQFDLQSALHILVNADMSAATTVTETASCWTMGRNVSVCRVFPIRCCAGGSRWPSCRWTRPCAPRSPKAGTRSNAAPSAGRRLRPTPTGPNTARIVRCRCAGRKRRNASGKDTSCLRI